MLESTKHYLWHGNVVRAQEKVQELHCYLDKEVIEGDNGRKMRKGLDEIRHLHRRHPGSHSQLWRAVAE